MTTDYPFEVPRVRYPHPHQGELKELYAEMLGRTVATFYLPVHEKRIANTDNAAHKCGEEENARLKAALTAPPFECTRVVSNYKIVRDDGSIDLYHDSSIVEVVDAGWRWSAFARTTYPDGTSVSEYSSHHGYGGRPIIPSQYMTLLEMLDDRRNAYIETPRPSRQVRRAEGLSDKHVAYIVVKKHDAPSDAVVLTRGEILRRHPQLHAVRGHLRHCRSGKIVAVRPHTRGQGDALQVKDYLLQ